MKEYEVILADKETDYKPYYSCTAFIYDPPPILLSIPTPAVAEGFFGDLPLPTPYSLWRPWKRRHKPLHG